MVEVITRLRALVLSTSCSPYSRTGQPTTALAGSRGVIHYVRIAKLHPSISALALDRTEETQ